MAGECRKLPSTANPASPQIHNPIRARQSPATKPTAFAMTDKNLRTDAFFYALPHSPIRLNPTPRPTRRASPNGVAQKSAGRLGSSGGVGGVGPLFPIDWNYGGILLRRNCPQSRRFAEDAVVLIRENWLWEAAGSLRGITSGQISEWVFGTAGCGPACPVVRGGRVNQSPLPD